MRRVPPPGGMWLDHIYYADTSSPEYLAARAAFEQRRRARRARLMARIEAERGSCQGQGQGIRIGEFDDSGDSGGFVPPRPS